MTTDGCPDCGRDIDLLGGNPDCPTCAAELPALREAAYELVAAVLAEDAEMARFYAEKTARILASEAEARDATGLAH